MKILKTYEGFFKDLFKKKRESDGLYYWTNEEIIELEKIGFERKSKSNMSSFSYESSYSEKIEKIKISKFAEVINYNEYFFYEVYLKKSTHKEITKDFDTFPELLEFIKPYISEIEIDSKKYNL